jgi:archaellum biogenesis ATPase FlaH
MQASPNKAAALALVSRGVRVFPCNPDKTPMVKDWEQAASNNPMYIDAHWSGRDPLPAIPAGAQGLVVIDADCKNGVDGVAAFRALCAERHIDLSNVLTVETPNNGFHFYFRTDTAFGNSSNSLPNGIDVRGVGYVIAPGAVLPDGRAYRIERGSFDSIPAIPTALAACLKRKDAVETPSLPTELTARPATSERERAYAESVLEDECEALSVMCEGEGRNAALNSAALRLGEMVGAGWIERKRVEKTLWEASERNGYRAKDGDRAARATMQSGLEAGIAKPRAPLPDTEVPQWLRDSVAYWIEAYRAKQKAQAGSLFDFLENIKPLQDYDIPRITYLVNGMIPEASIIMLSGGPGSGKSTLAMKIAYLASKGLPIFGTAQIPRRVLYLDKDNSPALVKDRMNRLRMVCDQRFKYWGGNLTNEVPKRIFADSELLRWLDREPTKPIVVIDSQIAFQEGKEGDSNDIRAFYSPLRDLTYRGVSIIVIHHTGKGESTKEFRGSEDIRAAIDVGYVVNNSSKVGLNKLTLTAFKARVIVEEEIAFNYVDGEFIPQNLIEVKTDNLTQLLRANPGITKSEFEKMAMEARFSRSDVRTFIDTGIGFGSLLTRRGERNAQLLYLPESIANAQI